MNGDRQSPAPNSVAAPLNLLRLIEEFEQGRAPVGFHHADHLLNGGGSHARTRAGRARDGV